jgi:hypothetical protein
LIRKPVGKGSWRKLEETLKGISNKQRERVCGLNSTGSGESPVAGSCEHINELPSTIKDGELGRRSATAAFKRDSAAGC